MKILIVGSTSVIACALAARFASLGDVKMAGRRDADIFIDLSQTCDFSEVSESFDVVVHTGADFGGTADDDFSRAELVNAVGTLSVCRLARKVGARHVVLISSIFAAYQNGDPYYGIYSLSKRHGEEVAQFFCAERGIPLTILRPTQIYDAAGACRRHQGLFYTMVDQAQAGQNIHIYGSHDARRNYLFLDDFAEICSRVIGTNPQGIFTCANPQSVQLSQIANAAYAAFGRGGQLQFLPEKMDLEDLPPIGDFRLYEEIGYAPRINVCEGIRRIREYRETHN